jgi:carboxypeptidase family protein
MKYIRGLFQTDSLVIAEPVTCREQGGAVIHSTPRRASRRALTTQKGMAKWLYLLITPCSVFVCEGAAVHAQSTFGSFIGAVQDPSGAVVPGAVIHVKNMDDNTTREARTNEAGEYLVLNLNPGSYSITASAENFVEKTLTKVTLSARQQLRADMKLQLAGSQTTVEVEATEAAVVNTENGTIGDTKIFDQVVELPMNYRGGNDSPLAALTAVPGVQQDSSGNISIGGGTSSIRLTAHRR